MDQIRITGGVPLNGTIPISGAKNAALKLMAASLLTDQPVRLSNVPLLADIVTMGDLLAQHGVSVKREAQGDGHAYNLQAGEIASTTAPYDIVRKMRASVLMLGPLLARCGAAEVSLPGGCAIGNRPVDFHLEGLARLGAEIELRDGYIHAAAPQGLRGGTYRFPAVSVGATENLLMAACLADGETVLENAAREPEITDLGNCLVAMGAEIAGLGTERLEIVGRKRLDGCDYPVMADRVEAGTYAIAAALAGGSVTLHGAEPDHLGAIIEALGRAGAEVAPVAGGLFVRRGDGPIYGTDVMTQPFPGFPTDCQAQFMALMTVAQGAAMITETIFENRFMHVPELRRMGADITVHGGSALIRGVERLHGAPVMATDLRASVSLVLAGLAAEGETVVNRVYHLDRGYERLEAKLAACGARIERIAG